MTTAQLAKVIGTRGLLTDGEFMWEIEIVDAKQAYGTTRYQVKPTAGRGLVWGMANRVKTGE